MDVFYAEVPGDENPEAQIAFQNAMNAANDAFVDAAKELAEELCISVGCAIDVLYFRSHSSWSQRKEDDLIRLHQEGNPPNINEF